MYDVQEPHSTTILENILSLVPQTFLYLEAFECNTTSGYLTHTVWPIGRSVTYKFTNIGERQ